jgi:hypothetical protein
MVFAPACERLPCETTERGVQLQAAQTFGGVGLFGWVDEYGKTRTAKDPTLVPDAVRDTVAVYSRNPEADGLPDGLIWTTRLQGSDGPTGVFPMPMDVWRGRNHAAHSGHWAGQAIAETASSHAVMHPDSEGTKARLAAEAAVRRELGDDPIAQEKFRPAELDAARRHRRIALRKPDLSPFVDDGRRYHALAFGSAECPAPQRPWTQTFDIAQSEPNFLFQFLTQSAATAPALPMRWENRTLWFGNDAAK